MAIGETIFDIIYLLYALFIFKSIINPNKQNNVKYIKFAVFLLFVGDSCHLIPRILNYYINYDFNMFIGLGKFMTSITMTLFYFLLYKAFDSNGKYRKIIIFLVLSRILLCFLPGNGWLTNSGSYIIGIIRNIPFVILGIIMIKVFYNQRNKEDIKNIWLYTLLSFIFYIPVVLGASIIPMLGMFMIPKTICYMKMISCLYSYTNCINESNKE